MARLRFEADLEGRNIGALAIIIPILKCLEVKKTVDSSVPTTARACITHGDVVCALVLNRLISPRAVYNLNEWAEKVAIPDALKIPPEQLNDDRILRALDAIYPHIEAMQGSLAWRAIEAFDMQTEFLHWDMTSFFFEGDYDEAGQNDDAPLVRYGQPKKQDAGKRRKQIQAGFATTADGGVPFWHRTFSGNAAEISQVGDVMEHLKSTVRHSDFTLVGDSKLLSRANILKALKLGISFLAPEPRSSEVMQEYQTAHRSQPLRRLSYGQDKRPRKGRRYVYMGFETAHTLTDPDSGKTYPLRRLFIASAEERRAVRKNRRRKLAKLDEDIAKIQRNLGRYSYKDAHAVRSRVEALLERYHLQGLFIWNVEGEGRTMQLHFARDPAAFKALRQQDGIYTLLTSLPETYTMDQLLGCWKRQYLSENRFRDLKGPLHLRPVFLKKNQRIVSLVFVTYIALMCYCLLERGVRQHLKASGTMLLDPNTRRPVKEPTGRWLLRAFEFWFANVNRCGGELEYVVSKPTPVQRQIIDCLGIKHPLDFLAD